ncbi:MAG: preprotein translocase subunit YajC [Planctomycetaceae bacterium]|jgi:preprotein translocase subunit YajC|nr:preprotein translocase subunit YajC [Planctomycetaceae bacterium]
MNVFFSETSTLIAQAEAAKPPQQAAGQDSFLPLMVVFGVVIVMMWFFMIRPQQRQEEAARKLIDSLKQNDKVYTVGGIVGIIHSIDKEKNEIILKVDETNNTKIKFVIQAIQGKIDKDQK